MTFMVQVILVSILLSNEGSAQITRGDLRQRGEDLETSLEAYITEGRCSLAAEIDTASLIVRRVNLPYEAHEIRAGDRLLEVERQIVNDFDDIAGALSALPLDGTINFKVERDGEILDIHQPCRNYSSLVAVMQELASALSRGNGIRCLTALDDVRQLDGNSFYYEWVKHGCSWVDDPLFRTSTRQLATSEYELIRLDVEERKYIPGELDSIRVHILSTISTIEDWGERRLAADLESLYDDAVEYSNARHFSTLRESSGTCFVVAPDGLILTNEHVIADHQRFEVT